MGHLFSRAFKRLTQGSNSQSRNQQQQQQQEQQNKSEQQESGKSHRVVAESIPVGQSIDSAEYAALGNGGTQTKITTSITTSPPITTILEPNQDDVKIKSAVENSENLTNAEDEKQGVEEAAIKIQALVRGHLTRKALKDAHHHHSVPPPNSLGQSQFDENSLTRNPPSTIFTQLSLNGIEHNQRQQPVAPANSRIQVSSGIDSPRTSLDPIAEAPIECFSQTTATTTQQEVILDANQKEEERKKLSLICSRTNSSPSQLETPQTDVGNRDSLSPVPSEANASIDLTCDTPASASINMSGSNLVPADKMASVLYHKQEERKDEPNEAVLAAATTELITDKGDNVAQLELGEDHEDDQEGANNDETRVTINENGVVGTPDSLDSEEAAAIRIQSAFRGYRTRKNSPYRTRSPNSSASKRNALRQQEATILDESDEGLTTATATSTSTAAMLSNGATEEIGPGAVESTAVATVSDINESALVSDERRSSRTRHRDCAAVEQQVNQRIPSAEEFTTTEDEDTTQTSTVKSVLAQHQDNSNIESAKVVNDENDSKEEEKQNLGDAETGETSLSVDIEELEPNTLEELGLSAALESIKTTASTEGNGSNKVALNDANPLPVARPSLGSKSQNSIETYDTDSSVLGAALSLTEDLSVGEQPQEGNQLNTGSSEQPIAAAPTLEPIDEALSVSANLLEAETSESSRLKDQEQTEGCESEEQGLTEGNLVEDEENLDVREESTILNEQEQHAIELESDDIERRDPRGQVSEERTKSPQIRLDEPEFSASASGALLETNQQTDDLTKDDEAIDMGNDNLSPIGGDESGLSSPAIYSSAANSSEEEDSDPAMREAQSPNNDQANKKQQQPGGKNRKKNNRNKKKGKK